MRSFGICVTVASRWCRWTARGPPGSGTCPYASGGPRFRSSSFMASMVLRPPTAPELLRFPGVGMTMPPRERSASNLAFRANPSGSSGSISKLLGLLRFLTPWYSPTRAFLRNTTDPTSNPLWLARSPQSVRSTKQPLPSAPEPSQRPTSFLVCSLLLDRAVNVEASPALYTTARMSSSVPGGDCSMSARGLNSYVMLGIALSSPASSICERSSKFTTYSEESNRGFPGLMAPLAKM
mmetsp:Transcript_114365/g.324481  ORF Transcript_114365/g.324481 Transcript_114365/m.324481 type:complete len:237 (-) Transcript_114365:295-1005(-)